MIHPTTKDLGRRVVFTPSSPKERGKITSFNEDFVFVRYDGDTHSKATRYEDLEWEPEELGGYASFSSGSPRA